METFETDLTTQLENIVRTVIEPLLKTPLEKVAEVSQEDGTQQTSCAYVHILGGWHGTVSTVFAVDLLTEITKNMLQKEEVSVAEVSSVSKELTNIIGGNLKGLLAADRCILSVPKERRNEGFKFGMPKGEEIIKCCFQNNNRFMVVRLHKALTEIL
jgi:CheY-specific phosphatase CheX